MTRLRPNYVRATISTFFWVAVSIATWEVIVWAFRGHPNFETALENAAAAGTALTLGVCLMFVPRELEYDADWFTCRLPFRRPLSCLWKNLEAYGWGEGVFMLKFRHRDTLLISGCAFRRRDWRAFSKMLHSDYPDRKCGVWENVTPIFREQDDD